MVLFIVKDIIESCVIVFLTIVLRAVTSYTIESISSNAFIVLCSIVILIVLKVLSNIIITVKKLIIMEFTIY